MFFLTLLAIAQAIYFQKQGKIHELLKDESPITQQFWMINKIDHFDKESHLEYRQRYWVNDEHWDGKGPIFLYLCGEGPCNPPGTQMYAFQVGSQLNAKLITLEHRYYGQSQPFPEWTPANFKYLSSAQALADIAYFIDFYNEKMAKDDDQKKQWIVIGGSYPGALSAWFKEKYPDHVVASWSSSGVIQPIKNFYQNDQDVYESALKSGASCVEKIQDIVQYIDGILDKQDEETKDLFNQFDSDIFDFGEFSYFIADIIAVPIQYSKREKLCQDISGLEPVHYIHYLWDAADKLGLKPELYNSKLLKSPEVKHDSMALQWSYQYCTEFGWFQVPNKDHPMRSKRLGEDYWTGFCQRLFGEDIGELDVSQNVARYGGTDIGTSNTFFLNASEDPWKYASMQKLKQFQEMNRSQVIDCDNCGHCIDLSQEAKDEPKALAEARGMVKEQIQKWLQEDKQTQLQFLSK